ncbi:MAG: hypothetical protein ACR65R_02810 [Methylomicrobium sp.]
MHWLIWIVLAMLLFKAPPTGTVFLILYGLFLFARRLFQPVTQDIPEQVSLDSNHQIPPFELGLTSSQLADLLVLRRELNHLLVTEKIDPESYRQLNLKIDRLEDRFFANHGVVPGNDLWQERKDAAWDILNAYADEPLGPAPWRNLVDSFAGQILDEEGQNLAIEHIIQGDSAEIISPLSELPEQPDIPAEEIIPLTAPLPATLAAARPSEPGLELAEEAAETETSRDVSAAAPETENYAWHRHEPGLLEKTLKTLSGWHALAAPFLVQNIGWFIGVFLFIAGSVFLVSYSTGYLKSLIVFLTFFLFTLFLLWGGYQLRRKRPDLSMSSDVVLILSLLLIPLTTVTVTRLLISSETLLLRIVSILLAMVEFGVFYFAATLVSAMMERSLQGRLPKIFLLLTFLQLLLALLNAFPYWPLLAVSHGMLLALLGVGVYRFVNDWLHSIFIDQRKIAYFASGILMYAALVSFVHLTYGAVDEIRLPTGYYGPFLIVLCGLLFYVDAQFKRWTRSNPTLSRFSFFIYGLSILALFWVAGQQTASLITLILAIALYALVIWNHLTLTPLYLFLGCCFWLYQLAVLRHVPEPGYFLAALPGFIGLYWLARRAMIQRRSAYLVLIVYRVLYAFAICVTVWSLTRSEPGILAMSSAVASGVLFYFALKSAPEHLFTVREQIPEDFDVGRNRNLLDSAWFYLLPGLAAATAYYAPSVTGLTRITQFAFAALPVAGFWGSKGFLLFAAQLPTGPAENLERQFNAALLTLAAAALPVFWMNPSEQALWLGLAGSLMLWFSLKLQVRWLFYMMLGCFGGLAVICKLTYFPGPTSGLMPMAVATVLWLFLKYLQFLERLPVAALKRQQAAIRASLRPSFKLLWLFPVNAGAGAGQDA